MAKYDPLLDHLCRAGDGPIEMTFDEIDSLVGGLPASATRFQAWWSNELEGTHVQARAWMDAGREVLTVDRTIRRVTFSATRRRGA
jgi:hypothetical protein